MISHLYTMTAGAQTREVIHIGLIEKILLNLSRQAVANDMIMASGTSYKTPLRVGLRVIRGPDWKWKNQDGGEGHLGTVVETENCTPSQTVVVQWDNGLNTNYRIGRDEAFDLRAADNAQIGVVHSHVACCAYCEEKTGIAGFRWMCVKCKEVNLCSNCYHSDKHDLEHEFRRFDSQSSKGLARIPPRKNARKVELKGFFPGAKVQRGRDWPQNELDKGPVGQIMTLDGAESPAEKSLAKVYWPTSATMAKYRVGYEGKVDLQIIPNHSGLGGSCYIEHLPILGKEQTITNSSPVSPAENFNVGERVKIFVDAESLMRLQDNEHGGFTTRMAELVGKLGRVHRITNKGNVRVQYPGKPEADHKWTINPAALRKVSTLEVGDFVRVSDDEGKVQALQRDHGGWVQGMQTVLGKTGTVELRYGDDTVRVTVANKGCFTFNPKCLTLLPPKKASSDELGGAGSSAKSSSSSSGQNVAKSDENFTIESAAVKLSQVKIEYESGKNMSELIRDFHAAARQGQLQIVKLFLDQLPHKVEARLEDKAGHTALHHAIYQGHLDIADLLLTSGAKVTTCDLEGDNALHFAALGKQATAIEFIMERGEFDVNQRDKRGFSPLLLAVLVDDEECVRTLLKHKADVNVQNEQKETALHKAICQRASEEIVDLLLQSGKVDFSLSNAKGFNILHAASLKGNVGVVRAALAERPDLAEKRKRDGFTPLHLSSLNGCVEVTKLLLTEGKCQPDLPDKLGRTPLHHASSMGYYKIMELLLHNGEPAANPNYKDQDGAETPLHLALAISPELAKNMESPTREGAAKIDPAIYSRVKNSNVPSLLRRSVSLALLLILNGADPTAVNKLGSTPLDNLKDPNARSFFMEQFLLLSNGAGKKEERKEKTRAKKQKSRVECRVCSELVIPVTFKPCGHKVTCTDCSVRMKKCIECKVNIESKEADGESSENSADAVDSASNSGKLRALEKKVRDLEEACICLICMERRKNVVFLCGHGACSQCVETLKLCHMCRGAIGQKINIY